jgi:hypothetical protein
MHMQGCWCVHVYLSVGTLNVASIPQQLGSGKLLVVMNYSLRVGDRL